MNNGLCGFDFGTTNSALSVPSANGVKLVPFENGKLTIPTALFFNFEDWTTQFGQQGINEYIDGYRGRLMRSLKSVLGSSLMNDTTQIGHMHFGFDEIVGLFISHIKNTAENEIKQNLRDVVVGRPIHFVDDDITADKKAESELRDIFVRQGFKNVSFEFEPIAAAKDYESTLSKEELVLIVDIGGGTSDFSLIRLSPESRNKDDRMQDILANSGIHIGGTNLDKKFSLASVMPEMGYRTQRLGGLSLPETQYRTLSTWHEINSLYKRENKPRIRQLYNSAVRKDLVKRLVKTIDSERGHELANSIEQAKILLSSQLEIKLDLAYIEPNWQIKVLQAELMEILGEQINKIMTVAIETVTKGGGLNVTDIKKVFMTGGTTGLPAFKNHIQKSFPNASIIQGDRFSSVAKGLGISAIQRYGVPNIEI
jgi:hypothetical chaperone protein